MLSDSTRAAIEAVFRRESGQILASLIRVSGSLDLAEDALQEAFASALKHWPEEGIPAKAGAWITTAARRKVIDHARRERTRREKQEPLQREIEAGRCEPAGEAEEMTGSYPDDQLRLMFTCCHPALNLAAQVALTLRTLGGLSTEQIARAFLVDEATLAQRLVRAKAKIRDARIPYQIPPVHLLAERLAAVQAVLYLIFNEGYASTTAETLTRSELCGEAIRLARLISQLIPGEPENLGLLALMLLQDSRREARVDAAGHLVVLEEQDRSLWNRSQMEEGLALVETSLRLGRVGPYQLQAAIAAVHAQAQTASETDWKQIAALYGELSQINPSAVVALNRAVAVAMSESPERGLQMMEEIEAAGSLSRYYLFHAARADLLRRVGRTAEAQSAYVEALALSTNPVEQAYLRGRLSSLAAGSQSNDTVTESGAV